MCQTGKWLLLVNVTFVEQVRLLWDWVTDAETACDWLKFSLSGTGDTEFEFHTLLMNTFLLTWHRGHLMFVTCSDDIVYEIFDY